MIPHRYEITMNTQNATRAEEVTDKSNEVKRNDSIPQIFRKSSESGRVAIFSAGIRDSVSVCF